MQKKNVNILKGTLLLSLFGLKINCRMTKHFSIPYLKAYPVYCAMPLAISDCQQLHLSNSTLINSKNALP